MGWRRDSREPVLDAVSHRWYVLLVLVGLVLLAGPQRVYNFLHPDRPAWTWMPTLKGPLRPLWPVYRWWAWRQERNRLLNPSFEMSVRGWLP